MADRPDDLDALAERLRAADALGRSDTINRLFDFLLERSKEGAAPKEIEVAEAVFGRRVSFDIAQDSTVRVNVHRLRKKLDDYYAGAGRDEPFRLTVPKGEYRLVASAGAPPDAVVDGPKRWSVNRLILTGVTVLLALNLVLGAAWWIKSNDSGFGFARKAPAWKALLADNRPITLVVGDYFIFGEMDDHMEVSRLVREYEINSSEDLADYMMNNPDKGGRYVDVNLYYLPTSVASALRSIMPVLATTPAERDRIHVITSSQLTADILKHNDIVYVGYLDSRLGLLRDQVFAGSRYRVGDTYDELIDQKTGKNYVSQEGGPEGSETHRDYGYFSSFIGPNGNRIVVVAGTRDIGVVQTAEMVSGKDGIKEQTQQAKGMKSFEALYEVQGVERTNLRGRLLNLSPIQAAETWDLKNPLVFPRS